MQITKRKEITVKREILSGIKCDVCGKDINKGFWTLTTGHNDWGNDSCDSMINFDLCSKECVQKKLDEYFKDCCGSNTHYFELCQSYFIEPIEPKEEENGQ